MTEGIAAEQIAVLVRTNGQLVGFEAAFRAAGVPFQVRGERFFARPEIRRAVGAVRSTRRAAAERPTELPTLTDRLAATWARALDFRPDEVPAAEEARQRHGALLALLEIGRELETADPDADADAFLAEIERRTSAEAEGRAGSGVELLTYHRAKGLEWDAVFLPALEEGILPIRQASEPAEIEEERRLLYVGITRARVHLWLSSARLRDGKSTQRRRSRFLLEVMPTPARGPAGGAAGGTAGSRPGPGSVTSPGAGSALFEALRAWRLERARADAVPPYVIFHDATLTTIAERRPRSLADLAGIPGIGPTKLDRYGEELIAIVVGGT